MSQSTTPSISRSTRSKSVTRQRNIPSIDRLLRSEQGRALEDRFGKELALEALRHACADLRREISHDATQYQQQTQAITSPENTTANNPADQSVCNNGDLADATESGLAASAGRWLENLLAPGLKPVFNLTGTVLHTNLGRAPLPQECIDAVVAVSRGASNIEFDLDAGKRGNRDQHIEKWLCRLTGAEAATIVNNNAAAVLLTLNSLCLRRQVAVSRGELVEIGDSFRMPDIMKRAGCRLVEIGTTNRTYLKDYAVAVDNGAAAMMRVHTSNYEIQGFTCDVSDRELGKFAKKTGAMFINDLGSGALIDMSQFGLPAETTPADAISEGANVVTFSGDKLLGGPQCGLIVGDYESIQRIKRNPMKRALRCDKMTIAALETILQLYADPRKLARKVPALRLLTRTEQEISKTAEQLLPSVRAAIGSRANVTVKSCDSQIGSGALPIDRLPSKAIVFKTAEKSGAALQELARAFRQLPLPVIGRINKGELWFDLRCLEDSAAFIHNIESGLFK